MNSPLKRWKLTAKAVKKGSVREVLFVHRSSGEARPLERWSTRQILINSVFYIVFGSFVNFFEREPWERVPRL